MVILSSIMSMSALHFALNSASDSLLASGDVGQRKNNYSLKSCSLNPEMLNAQNRVKLVLAGVYVRLTLNFHFYESDVA